MLAIIPNFEVVQEDVDVDEATERTAETVAEIQIETETLPVITITEMIAVVDFENVVENGILSVSVISGMVEEILGVEVVAHIYIGVKEVGNENGIETIFTTAIPHHEEADHQTCAPVEIPEMDT